MKYIKLNSRRERIRTEYLDDREYLVVPVTMLKEQVLNGSRGPLFYPESEILANIQAWNNIPVVVNHPSKEGKAVSARSPQIHSKFRVGMLYNAVYRNKLVADAYIDVKKMEQVAPDILNKIRRREPVEVSTGLFTTDKPEKGEHNGVSYEAIATNYNPDHLAILTEEPGACSIADGCGLGVNKKARDQGQDSGHNSSQKESTTSSLRRETMKLSKEEREEVMGSLVGNCVCSETGDPVLNEEDLDVLSQLSDASILALNANYKKKENTGKKMKCNKCDKEYMKEKGMKENMCPECSKKSEKETNNAAPPAPTPMTEQEWLDSAPSGIREVVENAMAREQQEKESFISKIVVNEKNPFTKEYLNSLSVKELEGIAVLAGSREKPRSVNYEGQATGFSNNARHKEEPLVVPVLNFDNKDN
jgi:hypothetical protein